MAFPNGRPGIPGTGESAAELRALLSTVRDDRASLDRALRGDVRWPVLGMLAEREKAIPVLDRAVRECLAGEDPPPVDRFFLDHLGRLATVTGFRLLELERRLDRLLEALADAGIDVLLLKGAALWRTAYSSPLERPMGDVDLLVAPGRAEDAREVAGDLGWGRRAGLPPEAAYETHHHLAPMEDRVGMELGLEIHTELFPDHHPFALSARDVWRDSRPSAGAAGRIPSSEHLLLHAALHYSWSHACAFGLWRTLRDADRLVAGDTLDWDRFIRTAHEVRGSSGAFWTLHLAREWAGVPVDERVVAALRPANPAWVERSVRRHLASRLLPPEGPARPVLVERLLWEAAMRPRACGHGTARPWTRGEKWLEEEGTSAPDSAPGSRPGARVAIRRGAEAALYLVRLAAGARGAWPD
jgi:hypothetical protein